MNNRIVDCQSDQEAIDLIRGRDPWLDTHITDTDLLDLIRAIRREAEAGRAA